MTGQGWPVLDGLSRPISLHARKMQQHGEARGPFNERADRGTAKAEDEVAFPMSGDCPVFDLRWSLADHDGFSEERLSTVAGALARQAKGPPRAQARSEEHTYELQSLMRISYADFCLKKITHQKHRK